MFYSIVVFHSFFSFQWVLSLFCVKLLFCSRMRVKLSIRSFFPSVMYQLVPSLIIPWVTPGDSHVFTASGVAFSPNFFCPGGRGFKLEKFATVLKEKCRNFSICFKEIQISLKNRCCFISIFAKTVDVYCIFNNIDHFGHFDKLFRSSKGHFC